MANLNAWSTKCCWLRTKDRNWTRKQTLFARNSLPERILSCFHANLFFSHFQIYKHAFPLFLINSFDNDDMKSSKRHVALVSLIFLLKYPYLATVNILKTFSSNCKKLLFCPLFQNISSFLTYIEKHFKPLAVKLKENI